MKRIIKREYFYVPYWIIRIITVIVISVSCALLFYTFVLLLTGEIG